MAAFSLIAVPAQAASATVYIYKVYFDSPGSDTGSNSSLNAEYVVIRNGYDIYVVAIFLIAIVISLVMPMVISLVLRWKRDSAPIPTRVTHSWHGGDQQL